MLHNEDILIENIIKKGNKVLIWGACERNNDILEFFRQNDVNVVGYIDQNADEQNIYNDLPVYNKDIIRSDSCFVYVGLLKTYDEVISHLESNNYSEFADYWYPNREIKLNGSCGYKDLYGNEYVGEKYSIDITLKNCGKLYIGENCEFNDVQILVSEVSEIKIDDKSRIIGKCKMKCVLNSRVDLGVLFNVQNMLYLEAIHNSVIRIGDKFRIVSCFINSGYTLISSLYDSQVNIAQNVSSGTNLQIASVNDSEISIDENCMFSRDIIVKAGTGHNMFDLINNENLSLKRRKTIIGKHSWIGQKAILFNGCEIGNGSIVGINTFVNKPFPNNCSIAGNPARIIKENIAWKRESYPYFESYDDFAEFDFR